MSIISLLPLLLFISLLQIFTTNISYGYKQCMNDQKSLLLELKKELKFDSSISQKLVRWNETDNCCRWEGVKCDAPGHVISLELDKEGIYGGLLETSSTLFKLTYLKKLNLASNSFNRNQIPRGIGNLTSLTHLNLSHAGFGGQIPMEISLLRRLVSLDVSSHDVHALKLEYPNLGMVLHNLTRLKQLYLDRVNISHADNVKWYDIISSSLPNLRNLSLSHCGLSTPSDPSLLQFHSLTVLRLDGNNLSTVLVPNFFTNFSSLNVLSLSNCSLKGSLNLSSNSSTYPPRVPLAHLNLAYNSLSGNIPHSLFGLRSLQTLDLSNNQFSGQAHEFPALNFSNIKILDLGSNRLEGYIPESFFKLQSIEHLTLSYNLFNGTFRLEKIRKLRNLVAFDLSYNKYLSVDASITNSSSVFTYPQLEYLRLASCNLHYFPDFIRQSSTLQYLDLSNNRIGGEIPSWIWELKNGSLYYLNLTSNLLVDIQKPYNIPASLEVLDLHSNQLRGELPQLPQKATYVDYSHNNFDNPILSNIPNFSSSLFFLSLKSTSLSGSIPPSLCNSVFLKVLDLSFNKLSGNIPPCLLENMESLEVLNLGRNNINGAIPDTFSVNCSLKTLELSDNNLTGDVPLSLASCRSLVVMNVANNTINDTFPCMLSSTLRILILRCNRFYGEVGCHDSFPNLQIIDIASNHFSGTLHPKCFSSWRAMMGGVSDARLGHNCTDFKVLKSSPFWQNEVTLIIKGLQLNLVKIWPDFTFIDFSRNNIQGKIPEAIGDLTSLYLLNLSHNALTGAIPKSLGKLTELGSLDLCQNQLTGMIPMELAKLTFLSVLNLSYNKLVGEIPIGPQLQTFSSDSFKGNRGLCGKPSNISCRNTEMGTVKLEEKKETEWEYVSAVVGYVVGLGSFVWVLFGCISFRDIYFDKVDDIIEKIFLGHKRRGRRRHGRK